MNKFFDYLQADLPLRTIRELVKYIRRFPSLPLARIHKLKIGYILRTNTRNI